MSQLDDLLQRSRTPGRFVERRRFSLSRDKAIEKLREFSLRNPRQYVLELVQAAVFSGATYVAIDVDSERMLLAWVGAPPLGGDELGHVFDYLFADRGARPTRHLVQLAIGLNALLQRKPKVLRVESGDGTLAGTVRLDLDRKGNGRLGQPHDPLAGTYILAEFSSSWAARFQGDGFAPEAGLVESECRYTPVPILLNGRAPFGWKASRSITWFGEGWAQRSFDDGARRGVVALANPPTASSVNRGFQLVVGGVRVTTTRLPELGELPARGPQRPEPVGLTGVLCDDDLRKTADQSDIVRDTRFSALLHAVQPYATDLLRNIDGKRYVAPRLPEIAATDDEAAEPVPDPIPQLLPRPPASVAALAALPDGAPCFWVHPDDAEQLWAVADPARFAHPVLVLTPPQIETLDALAPQLAVHRLGSAADVEFVRRAIEQRLRTRAVAIPFGGGPGGTLHLTLVLDGPRLRWGDPATGDVAARITCRGRTAWCAMEPLGLPGLSVALETDAPIDAVSDALAAQVGDAAVAEAWRLVPEAAAPVDRDALRRFAAGLLAAHARPHLLRDHPEGAARLVVRLPVGWGATAARLRALPLAPTTDGALTLDRLAALQGTDGVVDLLDPSDLALLAPLEERLGLGHVRTPGLVGLLGVVAHTRGGWQPWGARSWDIDRVTEIVACALTAGPVPRAALPPGWSQRPTGLARVVHLHRDAVPPSPDPLAGFVLLRRVLDAVRATPDAPAVDPARVEAAVDLARLHLAGHLDQLQGLAALPLAGSGRRATPRDAASWTDFAVSARHGALLDEPHTALLDLDQLSALERHLGERLRLRFDDDPDVWASLAAPDPDGWLVRHAVSIPGLRGWLGLRLPFDGTSGVFLQSSTSLLALTDLDRAVPVHGLLWLTGGQLRPTQPQLELLQLARQELYQDLVPLVGRRLEADRAATSAHYAMAFVHAAWVESGGRLNGTAARLADRVEVCDPAGERWGTLRRWLDAPPAARPELPVALRRPAAPRAQRADATAAIDDQLDQVRARLAIAAGDMLGGAALRIGGSWELDDHTLVQVDPERSDAATASLRVNLKHPLAARIQRGDRAALELLALAAVRQLVEWGRRHGEAVDLLAIQRVLVAQRVG